MLPFLSVVVASISCVSVSGFLPFTSRVVHNVISRSIVCISRVVSCMCWSKLGRSLTGRSQCGGVTSDALAEGLGGSFICCNAPGG